MASFTGGLRHDAAGKKCVTAPGMLALGGGGRGDREGAGGMLEDSRRLVVDQQPN